MATKPSSSDTSKTTAKTLKQQLQEQGRYQSKVRQADYQGLQSSINAGIQNLLRQGSRIDRQALGQLGLYQRAGLNSLLRNSRRIYRDTRAAQNNATGGSGLLSGVASEAFSQARAVAVQGELNAQAADIQGNALTRVGRTAAALGQQAAGAIGDAAQYALTQGLNERTVSETEALQQQQYQLEQMKYQEQLNVKQAKAEAALQDNSSGGKVGQVEGALLAYAQGGSDGKTPQTLASTRTMVGILGAQYHLNPDQLTEITNYVNSTLYAPGAGNGAYMASLQADVATAIDDRTRGEIEQVLRDTWVADNQKASKDQIIGAAFQAIVGSNPAIANNPAVQAAITSILQNSYDRWVAAAAMGQHAYGAPPGFTAGGVTAIPGTQFEVAPGVTGTYKGAGKGTTTGKPAPTKKGFNLGMGF